MSDKKLGLIRIEGATIVCKDFVGKKYSRGFGVLLDDELANKLADDGWNVKFFKPREDDPTGYEQPWLKVKVSYKNFPPEIWMVTCRGRKLLDEVTVGQLDWSRFKNCDVIISPYPYPETAGRPAGVAAYVKKMFVEIVEDDFDIKYSDVPVIGDDSFEED